ncbi:hypothetical protein DFJ74DRAFT_697468 [Hyaloraphidium curvatum]|nr:hypothetical protein DFJ74DRAFT_697468 [Hyaloraphidium curvatum]
MDREGVVLGAAARGADASMHESPRSTVVLIHALLIYHAAECMLLAPPGNRISREWDRGTAAARWKEGCLRSGAVLKMMASAGEEGKLSTPFHVFNVHIAALYHVVWLLYVKSQLAGSWHAAVIGSLVTLVAGGHEGDPAASPPKPDVVAAGRFSDLPLVSGAEEDLGDEQPSELPDDAQKEVWAEAFRVIGSMQHLLQTLSALGTRARVKPLATRSRRLLVRLIEEKEPLVGTNHFAGVLLAEGGEEEEP